MEHIHEPIVQLDGLIKCRTCGAAMPYTEQELGKVSSARMANRLLDEIAVKGEFHADSFDGDFIVYSKDKDGMREELTVRKESDRVYVILRKLVSK